MGSPCAGVIIAHSAGPPRYDRFARSLRQLVTALDEFGALRIDFVSLHEGVDTSAPNGRLVFSIFATVAKFERELVRERVKSGSALARSRDTAEIVAAKTRTCGRFSGDGDCLHARGQRR